MGSQLHRYGLVSPLPPFPSVCAYSATDAPHQMQDGTPKPLLPAISSRYLGRKCLVLDLDETLVHSSLRVSLMRLLYYAYMLVFIDDLIACTCSGLYCPRRD